MSREQIIERERRWARPAAIAALVPLVLYLGAILIEQAASLYTGASDAEQLRSLHAHSGAVLLFSIVRAVGFLALPLPLLYLFRAAQARNPRVQAALVGFVFIGPVLFAAQGIVQWAGADQVSSDFETRSTEEGSRHPESKLLNQLNRDPKSIEKVTIYPGPEAVEIEQADGSFYSAKLPANAQDRLQADLKGAEVDSEVDSEGVPPDALARNMTDDSTGIEVAQGLLFPAVLGLVIAMIYLPLQALRAGLLTRFFGTLGMALGASLILILPVALLAILLWTGYLGLLYVGRVPGGRPPSWEAGVAIPWPRPGEEGASTSGRTGDAIEGEATELPAGGGSATRPEPGQPRHRRRKRKRRR